MKKSNKQELIVNLTNANSVEEIKEAFIRGKVNSGIAIAREDLDFFISRIIDVTVNTLFNNCDVIMKIDDKIIKLRMDDITKILDKDNVKQKVETVKKKVGFFKRLWNKIFKK